MIVLLVCLLIVNKKKALEKKDDNGHPIVCVVQWKAKQNKKNDTIDSKFDSSYDIWMSEKTTITKDSIDSNEKNW